MDKLSIGKLFERAKANDTIAQEELYEYYYERYHSFVILDKRIPNMEEIYIESIKMLYQDLSVTQIQHLTLPKN